MHDLTWHPIQTRLFFFFCWPHCVIAASPSWSSQDVPLLSRWQAELQESGYSVCVTQHQTLLSHQRRESGATDPSISVLSCPIASARVFLLQGVTSGSTFCDLFQWTCALSVHDSEIKTKLFSCVTIEHTHCFSFF